MGSLGMLGVTRLEATREANQLAADIHSRREVWLAATKLPDNATNRITVARQLARLESITSRYSAEIIT